MGPQTPSTVNDNFFLISDVLVVDAFGYFFALEAEEFTDAIYAVDRQTGERVIVTKGSDPNQET